MALQEIAEHVEQQRKTDSDDVSDATVLEKERDALWEEVTAVDEVLQGRMQRVRELQTMLHLFTALNSGSDASGGSGDGAQQKREI